MITHGETKRTFWFIPGRLFYATKTNINSILMSVLLGGQWYRFAVS